MGCGERVGCEETEPGRKDSDRARRRHNGTWLKHDWNKIRGGNWRFVDDGDGSGDRTGQCRKMAIKHDHEEDGDESGLKNTAWRPFSGRRWRDGGESVQRLADERNDKSIYRENVLIRN
jgi:hypothetical protein